jgi:tetratricopeptide (TPR) repeat protein
VRTREQLPQQWATTQNNLGTALQEQGIRTGGQAGARLLGESVSAYRSALQVYTREQLPQQWATTQNNLGTALQDQGIRTGGQAGARLLAQAVTAFLSALEVRTLKYLPQDWAMTQNNLAKLYEYREKWPDAIQCYQNVYKVYPAYAADKLASLYHDRVFRFEKALEMNIYLVEQERANRIVAQRIVENFFTTRLFKEGNQLIAKLKTAAKDSPTRLILLTLFETANFIVLNQKDTAAAQLKTLVDLVSKQAPGYKPGWIFTGTKHFIRTDKTLEPHRQILLTLFTAFEQTDRETILKKLSPLVCKR